MFVAVNFIEKSIIKSGVEIVIRIFLKKEIIVNGYKSCDYSAVMVFRERYRTPTEREGLLAGEDPYFVLRRKYLSKANCKSVSLGLLAGLIPFLLWVAIFQSYGDPALPEDGNLQDVSPGLPPLFLPMVDEQALNESPMTKSVPSNPVPVLKSIMESPNWNKISKKTYRKNKRPTHSTPSTVPVHEPVEFGTYPQPTFSMAGNRSIATYRLIATNGVYSPDGFPQPALLINGQSPGPEIRVKQNSILVVHLENRLSTPLTIHFHGMHQRKSFLSDGVPHVTQDPVPPGGNYTYVINLWPQTGTYFYHAHTGMDIVWIFGPLIIEDDPEIYRKFPQPYQYDDDRVFVINGVYHEELNSLVNRIVGPIHNYPSLVNSITINGRSFGLWENDISGEIFVKPTNSGYDITSVKKGQRYRFRFINAASDSILHCNVSSHVFTVIEVDGIYVEPINTDHIQISPGQRYSLIIQMDQEDDNYYIACRHLENAGPLNGLAILNYFNATKPTKEMLEFYRNGTTFIDTDRWILDDLRPNRALNQTDVYDVPSKLDKEFVIDVYEAVWGQRHVYLLNGHFYQEPEVPYFRQLQNGTNITDIPQVFELIEGETVQFVFQNMMMQDICFAHPWHIHGHDFHVVGEGPDKYDPVVDGARIQRDIESGKQFQFRDVVTVYANQSIVNATDGAYCGWAAIRFEAHNNGLWLGHCHVTPHLIMGKKFVIWEHSEDDPMLKNIMSAKYDYNAPGEPGGW